MVVGEESILDEFELMVGTDVFVLPQESVMRFEKNSEIRVIMRNQCELVLSLQKL